jgi:hypothetical protein
MPERSFDESFNRLNQTQRELERHGWSFLPIPREHAEGGITEPFLSRLRGQIKRRGFAKLAGRSLITFSGFGDDPRELHQIPEAKAYWRKLDRELPELPALLGVIEVARYNGPVLHVSLLGEVDQLVDHPERGGYDIHVIGAERIIANAVERIYAAGKKYNLPYNHTYHLIADFMAYSTFPPSYGIPKL